MQISARGYASIVARTADQLNVPLPDAYADQMQQIGEFNDRVDDIAVTSEELHEAVLDAIQAGRDFTADKKIQALALRRMLTSQNIASGAGSQRTDQLRAAALVEHADAILAGWGDALTAHADALVAAAEAGLSFADSAGAIARGGPSMDLMHRAQIAVTAWTSARTGFEALATVAGINLAGPAALIYTAARVDEWASAVEAARAQRRDLSPWDLARHRTALALPTLTEYQQRLTTFQADRRQQQQEEEKQRAERLVKSW